MQTITDFYIEYISLKLKYNVTEKQLTDIFGFITTQTQPTNKTHIYYDFIALEDKYMMDLHQQSQHNTIVPCLKNLLTIDLKI